MTSRRRTGFQPAGSRLYDVRQSHRMAIYVRGQVSTNVGLPKAATQPTHPTLLPGYFTQDTRHPDANRRLTQETGSRTGFVISGRPGVAKPTEPTRHVIRNRPTKNAPSLIRGRSKVKRWSVGSVGFVTSRHPCQSSASYRGHSTHPTLLT
jgi:hypothetical protein